MIDFAGLVGRITGKGAGLADGGTGASTETGVATGGQFAALVELAAQAEADRGQSKLRLVVDNGAAPAVPSVVPGTTQPAVFPSEIVSGDALTTEGDGTAAQDKDGETTGSDEQQAGTGQQAPTPTVIPLQILAAPQAVPQAVAPAAAQVAVAAVTVPAKPGAAEAPVIAKAQAANLPAAAKGVSDDAPAPSIAGPQAANLPAAATGASEDAPASSLAKPQAASLPAAATGVSDDVPAAPSIATEQGPKPATADLPARIIAALMGADGATARPRITAAAQAAQAQGLTAEGEPAEETTGPAEPQMLTTEPRTGFAALAARLLAPKLKAGGSTGQADAAPSTASASAAGAPTPADATRKTESGLDAGNPLVRTAETAVPVGTPLRAIVDTLPPVVQAGLGTATLPLGVTSVGAASGPSAGEALNSNVIDMGVSGQWIDRVAGEIAGLAEGTGHSRFTLSPPHLGRLQVDLWQGDGTTNVRMVAETDEAALRLTEARPALQADARLAALGLGSITVEKAGGGSFDATPRDQGQGQAQRDLSGQMQQQTGGNGSNNNARSNAQGSDWINRIAVDEPNQGEAPARTPGGAANGRVRFA